MPRIANAPGRSYRILCRKKLRPTTCFKVPAVRPSVLDFHKSADAWIEQVNQQSLVIFMGNQGITTIVGGEMEGIALNQLLFEMRQRNPRR